MRRNPKAQRNLLRGCRRFTPSAPRFFLSSVYGYTHVGFKLGRQLTSGTGVMGGSSSLSSATSFGNVIHHSSTNVSPFIATRCQAARARSLRLVGSFTHIITLVILSMIFTSASSAASVKNAKGIFETVKIVYVNHQPSSTVVVAAPFLIALNVACRE